MPYSTLTRRYFESAGGAGVLTGCGTSRGAAGSREQGTWVQFDVRVTTAGAGTAVDERERAARILEVRFLAYACPHVIAVAAWIAEHAVGLRADPKLPESVHALRERFAVPVEKLGRLLIVENAWLAACRASQPRT